MEREEKIKEMILDYLGACEKDGRQIHRDAEGYHVGVFTVNSFGGVFFEGIQVFIDRDLLNLIKETYVRIFESRLDKILGL